MAESRRCRTWTSRLRVRTLGAVIDEREAAESVRHVCDPTRLSVIERADDHIVFDAGTAIVKCGTRDAFGIEAWACEQARSLGVPAPRVISLDATAPIPHLALTRTEGVALCDSGLDLEAAARGAYQAVRCCIASTRNVSVASVGSIEHTLPTRARSGARA